MLNTDGWNGAESLGLIVQTGNAGYPFRPDQETGRGPPETVMSRSLLSLVAAVVACASTTVSAADVDSHDHHRAVQFDLRSARDGQWSDAKTWTPARVPKAGD